MGLNCRGVYVDGDIHAGDRPNSMEEGANGEERGGVGDRDEGISGEVQGQKLFAHGVAFGGGCKGGVVVMD